MKTLVVLLLLAPAFCGAQNCQLKKEKDQFTQDPKLSTGFQPYSAGSNRFLLSIDAAAKDIDFFISLQQLHANQCFDNSSDAVITFEGGRLKSNFKNTGSMNCEGLFHITFRNGATTPSILQRLATKKVLSIKLTGNDKKPIDISLSEEDQQRLMNSVACVVAEAKTLVK